MVVLRMSTVLRLPFFKSSANAFCDHYQQSRKEGTLFILLNAFHSNAQFLSFFVVCLSLTDRRGAASSAIHQGDAASPPPSPQLALLSMQECRDGAENEMHP